MNKTVTVNIGGIVFHIEEHAYEKLKKYLEAIRGYFTSSDGRDEIIQDIESRIAEMFSERIGNNRQVVTEADVDYMIDTMGRPEQVAGESDHDQDDNYIRGAYTSTSSVSRRLYRDPEDKVVGGVCSGISHYFGMDPIWLRLIFAVGFFVFGSGLLIYIILLVIIPKAKTTAEKLEMKGQPVNIDNIKRSIQDDVDDIKSRLSNGGMRNSFRNSKGGISRFFEALGEILSSALRVAGKLIAGIFMFILVIILIGMFVGVLAMLGVIGNAQIPVFLSQMFLDKTQITFAIIALVLILGIPALLLLYKIARSLFNLKTESKVVNYTSGILWGIGILIAVWLSISISHEFRARETQRNTVPILQPKGDTLYLDLLHPKSLRDESYYEDNVEIQDGYSISETKDTVRISDVRLDVLKSDNPNFELVQINTGRGSNRKEAQMNIRSIQYEMVQDDSVLKFSEDFMLPKNVRFRNQKIQLILKVPVGRSVRLGPDMDNIIYDIKNITNTWDGDMVNHTWLMTDDGLKCVDCTGLERDARDVHKSPVRIKVNGKTIDVNDIDNDNDTFNLDDKDVKIRIDGKGVVIDAKDKR